MREYDGAEAAAVGGPVGIRLAFWRGRRGLTWEELAAGARMAPEDVAALEAGRDWMDSRGRLAALSAALQLEPGELTGQPYPPSGEAHAAVRAVAFHLRRQMNRVPALTAPDVSLDELTARAAAARSAEAAGDEHALALALPALVKEADRVATTVARDGDQRAEALRVDVHVMAAGLLRRTGYKDLAWTLLHRARPGAREPLTVLVEEVKLLVALGLPEYALARAARAENAGEDPELPALSAIAHAMAGRFPQAQQLLAQADEQAADEPGQASVTATQAAVAVEVGEVHEAVEHVRLVNREALPRAGRTRLLITGAAANVRLGATGPAVAALAEAEETAPLRLRLDPFARELLAALPARVTDTADADRLSGLARRAGLVRLPG